MMKERIIKTYENYNLDDLDLGRFNFNFEKEYLIPNPDGTFDYNESLSLYRKNMNSFLDIPIKIKKVSQYLKCSESNLISLEGCPEYIGGYFKCAYNNLISLRGAPLEVDGDFRCYDNNLLSSVCLTKIKGKFIFYDNPFEITDNVIQTVKKMTIKQRTLELEFFEQYDMKAYKMLKDILIQHRIEFGSDYSKEIIKKLKDGDDNFKALGL